MSFSFQLRSHPNRPLREHLKGVAEKSRNLAESLLRICGQDLQISPETLLNIAHVIGASHDVGKATRYFQDSLPPRKVKPENVELTWHSTLSSLYGYYAARKLFSDSECSSVIPLFVSLAIQYHHGALESPVLAASKCNSQRDIIRNQLQAIGRREEVELILQETNLPSLSEFESNINSDNSEIKHRRKVHALIDREMVRVFDNRLTPFLIQNLLFSVLIDADRMDAAGLTFPERQEVVSSTCKKYVDQLSARSKLSKDADSTVSNGRDELFRILSEKAEAVPLGHRIYSLTAPTGYGKTLVGLHFALKLRERISQEGSKPRIVYVAPYLSILDQNFEEIAKALGVDLTQSKQSNVLLLHHHLADLQYQTSDSESFSTLDSELLIEGWNAEVIVTTFIQFFYTIIGIRASQLRKLHNLAGSIVILDEVQTIPHEYWGLIRETLKFIADKLKMYIILMTATQPLIFSKDETIELADNLSKESWKPRVIIRSKVAKDVTLEEFIEELNQILEQSQDKSTLIVMNTIDSATQVFNGLRTPLQRYYLSANIVPAQRRERLEKISAALKQRDPLVLVSTQVVEAGVDLDFDTVVRDLGPVDSIIQVAGRCNRNGMRELGKSEVYIYSVVKGDGLTRYANRIYGNYLIYKSRDVLPRASELGPFHLAEEYYHAVKKGSSNLKSQPLLKAIGELDYGKLRDFKLIDDQPNYSVFVEVDDKASQIWGRYVEILDSSRDNFQKKEEFLRMKHDFYDYVVNVSSWEVSALEQDKGFYRIPRSEIGRLYSEETGFIPVAGSRIQKQQEAWTD